MSEVNMQAVPVIAPNIQMALDYSRNFATAKPNIGLTEKEHIEGLANLLERTALENSGLQHRLTAADDQLDDCGQFQQKQIAVIHELNERVDLLEGLLRRFETMFSGGFKSDPLESFYREVQSALKPAEAPINQCDGCQAGIPVVNGAHRMGKPGGYADTMGCTAKMYKTAAGGGDEA